MARVGERQFERKDIHNGTTRPWTPAARLNLTTLYVRATTATSYRALRLYLHGECESVYLA
jgi:hypothetical protein